MLIQEEVKTIITMEIHMVIIVSMAQMIMHQVKISLHRLAYLLTDLKFMEDITQILAAGKENLLILMSVRVMNMMNMVTITMQRQPRKLMETIHGLNIDLDQPC